MAENSFVMLLIKKNGFTDLLSVSLELANQALKSA